MPDLRDARDRSTRPIIEAEAVTVRHSGVPALDAVTLAVRAGVSVAVVGPNGAGKPTLLRVLAGLQRPCSGAVRRPDGGPGRRCPRPGVAYVPQRSTARWDLPVSVLDAVLAGRWGLRCGRRYGRDDRRDALAALDSLGVAHLAHRRVGSLSGGQAQRALLARARPASEPAPARRAARRPGRSGRVGAGGRGGPAGGTAGGGGLRPARARPGAGLQRALVGAPG